MRYLQLIIIQIQLQYSKQQYINTEDPAMRNQDKPNKKITDYFQVKQIKHPMNKMLDRPAMTGIHSVNTKYSNDECKRQNRNTNKRQVQLQLQSNGTQIIQESGNKRTDHNKQCCKPRIMIGPCDVNYFKSGQYRLKKLLEEYSIKNVETYLSGNATFHNAKNLHNLIDIKDDIFWDKTLPKMIEYALDYSKQKSISSSISMMLPNQSNLIQLSKAQILMILINMFLCIFPTQTHRSYLSFAWLMTIRQSDKKSIIQVKKEKLKCIMNYFKIMMSRNYDKLQKQNINACRVASSFDSKSLKQRDQNLKQVQIERGYIQQLYQQSIMIDFSNKNIGGGVLMNGAVQQEILFCIFPQLIAIICICEQIKDNQAVVIAGAERINKYSGYSDQFKFQGTYQQQYEGLYGSVIVAIDAINFDQKLGKQNAQYTVSSIQRQLNKAIAGIGGAQLLADAEMSICTGRWGCGAFKGNNYLKFIIQWIACSIANRKMIYKAQDQVQLKQLKAMTKSLKKHTTSQLIQAIQQYNSFMKKSKKKITFLDFLKNQIS